MRVNRFRPIAGNVIAIGLAVLFFLTNCNGSYAADRQLSVSGGPRRTSSVSCPWSDFSFDSLSPGSGYTFNYFFPSNSSLNENGVRIVKQSDLANSNVTVGLLENYVQYSSLSSSSVICYSSHCELQYSFSVQFNATKKFGPELTEMILQNYTIPSFDWDAIEKERYSLVYVADNSSNAYVTCFSFILRRPSFNKINLLTQSELPIPNTVYPSDLIIAKLNMDDLSYAKVYLNVYRVPESFLNDTSALDNSSIAVLVQTIWHSNELSLNGYEPGYYVVAQFSSYGPILHGISDKFRVGNPLKPPSVTLVVTDTGTSPPTFYQGQNVTITVDGIQTDPIGAIRFFWVNVTDPTIKFPAEETYTYNGGYINATSFQGTLRVNSRLPHGRFRIQAWWGRGNTPLFLASATQVVRVTRKLSVSLPKRWYAQGEAIPTNVVNYLDYSYKDRGTYTYDFGLYIEPTYKLNYEQEEYFKGKQVKTGFGIYPAYFPPGQYNFELIWTDDVYYYEVGKAKNSTFQVVANNATIRTNKKQYRRNSDGTFDIRVTFTTMRKIPLAGPVDIYIIAYPNDNPCGAGSRSGPPFSLTTNNVTSTSLNGTITFPLAYGPPIDSGWWQLVSCFFYHGINTVWTTSKPFYVT